MSEFPTTIHVTHWKAGSVWLEAILRVCAPEQDLVAPLPHARQFLVEPIRAGAIYPRTYVTLEEFDSVELPPDSRRFVVIRDLRDTLVSWYFSLKLSHGLAHRPDLQPNREHLRAVSLKEGLEWLLNHWAIAKSAEIQQSWLRSGAPVIRYEELLTRDVDLLQETLIDRCDLPIDPAKLRNAVQESRFSKASGGRARGEERADSHFRKGIAGDWRAYFGTDLRSAFRERYGDLLIETGYESGFEW